MVRAAPPAAAALLAALVVVLAASAALTPGALDSSFGDRGTVTTKFGPGNDGASDVALQPDGKIVVAGTGDDRIALARYTRRGSLDPTFGASGKVTTAIGSRAGAGALVLQPDGKIVAAGSTSDGTGGAFALVRYTPTGALDPSFGNGGIVTATFGAGFAFAHALVLQPDGKLVAAGRAGPNFALARYETDGSLDPTFGEGGTVTTAFDPHAGDDSAQGLVLQPDGKLVAAGWTDTGANIDFALARYRTDGSLDPAFGSGGRVTSALGPNHDIGLAIVLQPDGKLVVAGLIETLSGGGFGLARYNADGSLDAGFGTDGIATSDGIANALVRQPDGKLVAAGARWGADSQDTDFVIKRYNANGSVDRRFGKRGSVRTSFGSGYTGVNALALQPNGRIVAVGDDSTSSFSVGSFALARYHGGDVMCVVPRVTGAALGEAKRAITTAHCTVGTVTHAFSDKVRKDRVLAQKPKPGVQRAAGARIDLVVSKGAKKH